MIMILPHLQMSMTPLLKEEEEERWHEYARTFLYSSRLYVKKYS